MMRPWRSLMTLTRDEQHALLRMEWWLRRDPSLRAVAIRFRLRCPHGREPEHEHVSPWHPVLWRAAFVALVLLTAAFVALVALLVFQAA